jgi:2-polyprenyl-3-methyl-5-hydroxy-6-metoxy-1,4-benzoquinol methylase
LARYYNWTDKRELTDADGCPLNVWVEKYGQCKYAIHPNGFRIFVAPAEIDTFDEYADGDPYRVEAGLDSPFQQRRFKITLGILQQHIQPDAKVRILDIGCGEGHITAKIAETFPNAEVCGLDYSISAVAKAVERYGNKGIDFIAANALDLPYFPNQFDFVVCNNIWEHVPDPLTLLSGLMRVTTDSSFLLISTPSRYRLSNLLRVLRGKEVIFMSHLHVTEYTVGQVREQLQFGGMDVVAIHSEPIAQQKVTAKTILLYNIIYPVVQATLKLLKSHHSLDSTVFYLAQKRKS